MSWQDELHQLDTALASGQLSADDYRVRRDALLSKASGQVGQPGQPQSPLQVQPQPQSPLQAPSQSQSQAPSPSPENERTQFVAPVVLPPQNGPRPQEAERTQAVRPGRHTDHTQVVGKHDSSADNTQIVPNSGLPPRPAYPVVPPWETVHPGSVPQASTPWGGDELPPGFGQTGWPRQGPEIFAEPEKGKGGKIALIALAVVLVLGLVGAGVWFFGFKDSDTAQPPPPAPTTTTKQEPVLPPPNVPDGPFIEIAGREALNRTMTIEQALQRKLPTERESKLMKANGIVEVGGLVTEENGLRRGIWAFKVADGGDASAALVAMDALYEQAKYAKVASPEHPEVTIRKLASSGGDAPTVFRAHYVTDGGYMVRVEAFGADAAKVETAFFDLLAEETGKFPPLS
ncbi:hypothetical protein ACTG9Q_01205 [Actinokineospora sp. 24-640]